MSNLMLEIWNISTNYLLKLVLYRFTMWRDLSDLITRGGEKREDEVFDCLFWSPD